MNKAQLRLYRREWGKARKWYRAAGLEPIQADNKRHAIHRQALGKDKSSLEFTNPELTKVLAAFRAVYDGGNLDAQMRAIEEPERIAAELHAKVDKLAEACGIERGAPGVVDYFRNWFRGRRYDQLNNRELRQLVALLERRAKQITKVEEGAPF